ncbi:MAG: hypothetical protein DRO39_04955 [Thermoprotei archaeon]|nr:MAG: hypothetical protein DRO39_04955 [Thermoprotei archaeon]
MLEHDKRFEALGRKMIEHDKRFEAIERKLLEHDKRFEAIERKLLEHDRRFEAIERKLLEHDKRFEAIERKLLEHDKRFEAIEKKLLEHDRRFDDVDRRLEALRRDVARLGDAVGALTESTYAKFFLDMVVQRCAAEGVRLLSWQRNAKVDGVDVDLLIVTEREVYVVEVKVSPSHRDVDSVARKADVVKRRYPDKKVVAVLTGARIGSEVLSYALGKGVEVYQW